MKAKILIIIFIILSIQRVSGQQVSELTKDSAINKKYPILYFDRTEMTVSEKESVFNALMKIQEEHQSFKYATVDAHNIDFNHILKNTYKIVRQSDKTLHDLLIQYISYYNGKKGSTIVKPGEKLKVPLLPLKADKNATIKLTQYIDIYNDKRHLVSSNMLAVRKAEQLNIKIEQGSLYAYTLNNRDIDRFRQLVSDKIFDDLLKKAMVRLDTGAKMVEIRNLEKSSSETVSSSVDYSQNIRLRKILKDLPATNFNELYVFDSFLNGCEHGDKVISLVRNVFDTVGLVYPDSHIHKVSIEFFDKPEDNLKTIEQFYGDPLNKNAPSDDIHLKAFGAMAYLEKYKANLASVNRCKSCVPEVYVSAIFGNVYKNQPDILSSSIGVITPDPGIVPFTTNGKTILIQASLDTNMNIEDLDEKTAIQPLFDYYGRYDEGGAIIVGARRNNGNIDGMRSKYGKFLSVFDYGEFTSQICGKDYGTSFAAPQVAAKLFIARAYWQSKNKKNIDAQQTRIRMLLATDLVPSCVGQSGSAGNINLEKLLQTGDGYAQLLSGEVIPIEFLPNDNSNSIGHDNEKLSLQFAGAVNGNEAGDICGIYQAEGKYYQFSKANLSWRQIEMNDNIRLTFKKPDGKLESIQSLKQFYSQYREIVWVR